MDRPSEELTKKTRQVTGVKTDDYDAGIVSSPIKSVISHDSSVSRISASSARVISRLIKGHTKREEEHEKRMAEFAKELARAREEINLLKSLSIGVISNDELPVRSGVAEIGVIDPNLSHEPLGTREMAPFAGPMDEAVRSQTAYCANVEPDMLKQLKSVYINESLDTPKPGSSLSQKNVRVVKWLAENARLVDGRFEPLRPWRDDSPSLPNNLDMGATDGCLPVYSFGAVSSRCRAVHSLRRTPVEYKLSNCIGTDAAMAVKCNTGVAIEIDPDTSYSCVEVHTHEKMENIVNNQADTTAPSYVTFNDNEGLIEDVARNQVAINLTDAVFDVKRPTGRLFGYPSVQSDQSHWPLEVISGNDEPKVCVKSEDDRKKFSEKEISSVVRFKMKEFTVVCSGRAVSGLGVTVRSYFNDRQRKAVAITRLNVLCVVSEPTAAVFTYALDKKVGGEHDELNSDLSGETFYVPILTMEDGTCRLKPTADTHLDSVGSCNRRVEPSVQEFKRKHEDLNSNVLAPRRRRRACGKAKRTFGSSVLANLEIDSLYEGIGIHTHITQYPFGDWNANLFRSRLDSVAKPFRDTKNNNNQMHETVSFCGLACSLVHSRLSGKELNHSIYPDKAFAYDAASKAPILSVEKPGRMKNMIVLDVKSLPLGLEMTNGIVTATARKNTIVPTKWTRVFATYSDNQSSGLNQLHEAERAIRRDNYLLCRLQNLLPLCTNNDKGSSRIELSVEIKLNMRQATSFEHNRIETSPKLDRWQITLVLLAFNLSSDNILTILVGRLLHFMNYRFSMSACHKPRNTDGRPIVSRSTNVGSPDDAVVAFWCSLVSRIRFRTLAITDLDAVHPHFLECVNIYCCCPARWTLEGHIECSIEVGTDISRLNATSSTESVPGTTPLSWYSPSCPNDFMLYYQERYRIVNADDIGYQPEWATVRFLARPESVVVETDKPQSVGPQDLQSRRYSFYIVDASPAGNSSWSSSRILYILSGKQLPVPYLVKGRYCPLLWTFLLAFATFVIVLIVSKRYLARRGRATLRRLGKDHKQLLLSSVPDELELLLKSSCLYMDRLFQQRFLGAVYQAMLRRLTASEVLDFLKCSYPLATDKFKKKYVAVKTFVCEVTLADICGNFSKAAFMMNFLSYPVMRLLGVLPIRYSGRYGFLAIFMDLMVHDVLAKYLRQRMSADDGSLGSVPRTPALRWTGMVANGMAFLNNRIPIHRDGAARNCVTDRQPAFEIEDFGLARHLNRDQYCCRHRLEGLPVRLMSIESLRSAYFTVRLDVWSCAGLSREIVTFVALPHSGLSNDGDVEHVADR